ncbi:hypothetical protein AcV5_002486 [Taiwanofungus camphoratus]|nr:hypothetical protein AcV5_002486 [Antrodia cinnamomea]
MILPGLPGENRKRIVFENWYRNPKGPVLQRPPPDGKRAPNGLVWGNNLDSFFWTERFPEFPLSVVTVWTRSMIQEYGENHFNQEELEDYEPDPYMLPPYHTLCILRNSSAMDIDKEDTDDTEGLSSCTETSLIEQQETFEGFPTASFTFNMPVSEASKHPYDRLPKLEEIIPDEYFPDILMVHDPDELATGQHKAPSEGKSRQLDTPGIKYKRIFPHLNSDASSGTNEGTQRSLEATSDPRVAHLYLSAKCRMGVGHHSLVYRAALTLPPPLTANSPSGQVAVAAKLAIPQSPARSMLKHEAYIYDKFPKHLMQDWSGYNLVAPHKYPVPVHAVVPTFYGYYIPDDNCKANASSGQYDLSPILLVEDCGTPIDPEKLSADEQSQCYTHVLRLHYEGFVQNSVYARNILIQPGPRWVHRSKRSFHEPSFRIIDFGRCDWYDDWYKSRYGTLERAKDDDEEEGRVLPWMADFQIEDQVNHSGLLAYLGAQFACPPQATKFKRDLQISARKVIQFSSEVFSLVILLCSAVFNLLSQPLWLNVNTLLASRYDWIPPDGDPPTLRLLLLTAHPDDECLFFAPTVLALLTQPLAPRPEVFSLCLSAGDADGLGGIRREELERSLDVLGIEEGHKWIVDRPYVVSQIIRPLTLLHGANIVA